MISLLYHTQNDLSRGDFVNILKTLIKTLRDKIIDCRDGTREKSRTLNDIVISLQDINNIPQGIIKFIPNRLKLLLKTLGDEFGNNPNSKIPHNYHLARNSRKY